MKITQSTWSPFQSPKVRDICAHLTPAEKQGLIAQASAFGWQSGWCFAMPFALVFVLFQYSRPFGFVLLLPFSIYCFTIERRRVQAHQQRVRELLAATEFAREHGYKPDALRMCSLPWSR